MLVLLCKTLMCSFSADSVNGRVWYHISGLQESGRLLTEGEKC